MIITINSFSQIKPVKPNTLVVLDIDETLLTFKNVDTTWWNDKYQELLPIYKENTYQHIEVLWTDYVFKNRPMILDERNLCVFFESIKNNNCELILLTARDISTSEMTMKHLNECGLIIDPHRVFFNRNKGYELRNIVMNIFPHVNNIVFVDDLTENLVNVEITFNTLELLRYNLELYKIKHIL